LVTQPVLDQRFVDAGEIRWVSKHFPLKIHPRGRAAAVAAECGGEQNRYWEMYHSLFQNSEAWADVRDDEPFVALAAELNLDVDRFAQCLASRVPLERVLDDINEGENLVVQTPTFIVISGGDGSVLRGALPAQRFVSTLETMLLRAIPPR